MDEEWKGLEMCLCMSQGEADGTGYRGTNEGSKLAGRANLWSDGALENNTEFGKSGFTALPGGYRYVNGDFNYMSNYGYFWSSTGGSSGSAWYRRLGYGSSGVYRYFGHKKGGFSIRCVRD